MYLVLIQLCLHCVNISPYHLKLLQLCLLLLYPAHGLAPGRGKVTSLQQTLIQQPLPAQHCSLQGLPLGHQLCLPLPQLQGVLWRTVSRHGVSEGGEGIHMWLLLSNGLLQLLRVTIKKTQIIRG